MEENIKIFIKKRVTEAAALLGCAIVILAVAYFSGFLRGFAPADFQEAYNKLTFNLSKGANGNTAKMLATAGNKEKVQKYNGYQPMMIPEAVLRGSITSQAWGHVLQADRRVIFFIYSDKDKRYGMDLKNAIESDNASSNYKIVSYKLEDFSYQNVGDYGPTKICNSLQECNAVRQKASDYSMLAAFFNQCSRTMCIINPQKQQYVILRQRNVNDAVATVNALKNW